jgi:hypothetical protein
VGQDQGAHPDAGGGAAALVRAPPPADAAPARVIHLVAPDTRPMVLEQELKPKEGDVFHPGDVTVNGPTREMDVVFETDRCSGERLDQYLTAHGKSLRDLAAFA